MKKILLVLVLCLSLFSCIAQKLEPLKSSFPKGDMVVLSIVTTTATLVTENAGHSFIVDAPKDLIQEWEYYFILEVSEDSKGMKTRPATIKFYEITPKQAAKNIAAGNRSFNKVNRVNK